MLAILKWLARRLLTLYFRGAGYRDPWVSKEDIDAYLADAETYNVQPVTGFCDGLTKYPQHCDCGCGCPPLPTHVTIEPAPLKKLDKPIVLKAAYEPLECLDPALVNQLNTDFALKPFSRN